MVKSKGLLGPEKQEFYRDERNSKFVHISCTLLHLEIKLAHPDLTAVLVSQMIDPLKLLESCFFCK
jgi:hypothetical protein